MDYEKNIGIPFGAFDSELHYQEINIPDGFEATIKDNKVILKRKESEDERIRKGIIDIIKSQKEQQRHIDGAIYDEMIAWLEKQGKRDARYKYLEELLEADTIYQMAMNDAMVEEAKTKAIEAISNMCIFELLGLEKQGEQKPAKNIVEIWKDMRLEVYQQASGNRHEPNYSDDSTKMFSLNDIDEIIEKIGEQKPFDYENANIQQKDFAPKAEPKFKVGDWICNDMCIAHIASIENGMYYFYEGDGLHIVFVDEHYHLWTIDDAEDGDVLVDSLGNVCIYQEPSYHSYCYGNHKCFIDVGGSHEIAGSYPATKEQRNSLMKVMTDDGYTFDFKKKELKKIELRPSH